jgi:uncharacterized protein
MAYTQTLAPQLPLSVDSVFGYSMLETVRQTVQQNLKCLVLTARGERVMDPEFGVGIKKYLFENQGSETKTEIKINIRQQVAKYMPYIEIKQADVFYGSEISEDSNPNRINVSITYLVQSVGIGDILNLAFEDD